MKKQNESKAKRVFNLIIVDESGSMSVIRKVHSFCIMRSK